MRSPTVKSGIENADKANDAAAGHSKFTQKSLLEDRGRPLRRREENSWVRRDVRRGLSRRDRVQEGGEIYIR